MGLDAVHPQYSARKEEWVMMRDTYAGEKAIKDKTSTYLPATPSQVLDGVDSTTKVGYKNYMSYLTRAVFHDYVSDAVESYIGLLHQKPAIFKLPEKMKPLIENATINGEGLQNLLRRINEQQLVTGRIGLLLDLPEFPDPVNPLPYIASYLAETIRNWDDSNDQEGRNTANMIVLDESGDVRSDDFTWERRDKYRVLIKDGDFYKVGTFTAKEGFLVEELRTPALFGKPLNEIPFKVINSKDVIFQPDNPPLIGLARLALAIYRGEAGYRESLFMQSQDTLVTIGGIVRARPDEPIRVGAGARIELDIGGDAKYIGVGSAGLMEQRLALENDKKRAETKSGQMMAPTGPVESDATLTTRMAAQTATLNQIAWSGAKGLEYILKIAAEWMGLNPDEVQVTPNLDFSNFMLEGQALKDIMDAKLKGLPVSLQSLHQVATERGLTQMSFEEEVVLIEQEMARVAEENKKLGLDPSGKLIPPAPVPAPARA